MHKKITKELPIINFIRVPLPRSNIEQGFHGMEHRSFVPQAQPTYPYAKKLFANVPFAAPALLICCRH